MASLEEELAQRKEKKKAVAPADIDFGAPLVVPEPAPEPEPEPDPVEEPDLEEIEPTVTQATVEDMQALIEDMRKEAQEAGYRAGLAEGFVKGQEEGNEQGYKEGFEKGREEGFAKGQEEGFIKGEEEGYKKGEGDGFEKGYSDGKKDADEYVRTFKAVSESFSADVLRANQVIAEDLLDFALDFSKAMLKSALKVRPELIVPVINEAVRYLPSLQHPAILYLNPEDAVVVKDAMGQELEIAGWKLVEEQVPRGSCRIETASNQIDSSLETRWQRLTSALGKKSSWME